MIDRARLLAWLVEKAKARDVVVGAVYQGLADRVRRGEFDEREEDGG